MSLPLTHAGLSAPGISAALDLKFASALSLTSSSGITPSFSRASTGTYFNSSGVLTSSANSAPRFDHTFNGTSWVSRGLLIEEQRTNILLQSNNFGISPWSVSASRGFLTQNAASPDGTTNAWTATCTVTSVGGFYLSQLGISSPSGNYTFSMFAKKGNNGFAGVQAYDSVSGHYATVYFDLTNGLSGNVVASGYTNISHGITNCGNGWYRCFLTFNKGNSNALDIYPILTADNMGAFAATSGQTNLFYGMQLESGAFPTSYIPTVASSATRSADVCQITGSDFSSFWNASEGSFALEYDQSQYATGLSNYPVAALSSGNAFVAITSHLFGGSPNTLLQVYNGTAQAEIPFAMVANGTAFKFAGAYKANDFAATQNGSAVGTDTSGSVPSANQMSIGYFAGYGQYINGHIARLRYFNKRLTDKQLEDLCKPEEQLKLDLKFSENLSLTPVVGPTPSFSRASTGTYFNASGVLTSAAINAPRFDHTYNGTSWVSRGLLVEQQRTNLAQKSEQFDDAYWVKNNSTISANAISSPDGTTNADKIVETSSTSDHGFYKTPGGLSTTTPYAISIYAKAAERTWIQANPSDSLNRYVWFDLANGTVGTNNSGGTATIQNVGNGWYRCVIVRTYNNTNGNIYWGPATGDGVSSYAGDTSKGVYFWGAQLESGAFHTSYIPTSNSSVVRSADVCQITGGDFTSFWNASEGSFSVEFDRIGYASGSYPPINYAYKTSSPGGDVIALTGNNNAGGGESFWVAATSFQAQIAAGSMLAAGVSGKIAASYKANDFAATLNGAAVVTDLSGSLPTVDAMAIGRNGDGSAYGNCHIARLRYYSIRLPNRLLIAKSQ